MMTKMEMQYMDAVIQINRRQRNNEVDWEQRRYEIAEGILCHGYDRMQYTTEAFTDFDTEKVKLAVQYADALIAELKKGK